MKKNIQLLYSVAILIFLQSCNSKVLTEVEVPLPEDLNTEMPAVKAEELKADSGPFELIKLPFSYHAFAPEIDAKTMENHYAVIYLEYTNNLNKAIAGTNLEQKSIEEILKNLDVNNVKLRNYAGGYYNHNLFFECMIKRSNMPNNGELLESINRDFETFKDFKMAFKNLALNNFGSGWTWLILDENKKLQVINTENEDNPLMPDAPIKGKPILCLDLWEHSHVAGGQARRSQYIDKFFNDISWDFISKRFDKALEE